MKYLTPKKKTIKVIAQNKEKYIIIKENNSVNQDIESGKQIFLIIKSQDPLRFLAGSLESLSKSLTSEQCCELRKYFRKEKNFSFIRKVYFHVAI